MLKFKTKPYQYQEEAVKQLLDKHFVGLWDEPGLGKSKIALDIASNRKITSLVILCPLRLIPTWKYQISLHYSGEVEPYFMHYESISINTVVSRKEFIIKKGILPRETKVTDLFIFDESHLIKNPYSKRGRFLTRYLAASKCQIISITGTPKPQDNRDLFMQGVLLDSPCSSSGYNAFCINYVQMRKGKFGMEWVRDLDSERLMDSFKDRVVARKKSDHLDLPPKVYCPTYYDPLPKQKEILKSLKEEGIYLMERYEQNKDVEILTLVKKHIINYVRLCSGYIVSEDEFQNKEFNEFIPFRNSPKYSTLSGLLETFPRSEKCIILTSLIYDADKIVECLQAEGYEGVVKNTGTDKLANLEFEFQNNDAIRILVANVQGVDVGMTLTAACRIIYYNNSFQAVHRIQSEDRINRSGQTRQCVYYDIIGSGMPDSVIYNKVMNRVGSSQNFMEMLRELTV